MIRVNLLNDLGAGAAPVQTSEIRTQTGLAGTQYFPDLVGSGELNTFDFALKVALLFLPLIVLFGYRQFLTTRAELVRFRLQQEQKVLDEKLRSYGPALADIEKFQERKAKLNSQLGIIKALSKERLKNVKGLDTLQGIVPTSAWLSSLKILSKDKIDHVELEGFAVNDVVVSEFMQLLSSSIYFSHVVLAESSEAKTAEGTVKRFKIRCNLETN